GEEKAVATTILDSVTEKKREAFELLIETCAALRRENQDVLYASLIKDTMKRKKPSFSENYYGYRSFNHLLADAAEAGISALARDARSGSYVVTGVAGEAAEAKRKRPAPPRRRRS